MALDEARLFEAASASYERGRLRWALVSIVPIAIIPLGSFAVGHRLWSSVGLGVALLGIGIALLWRGQDWTRGLSSGLKAGLIPLVFSHAANLYGHVCTPSGCTSLCVPACTLGGALAGFIVANAARRSTAAWQVLGAGGIIACLVGAFGCACVGFGGIAGLVVGTAISVAVTRPWARAA